MALCNSGQKILKLLLLRGHAWIGMVCAWGPAEVQSLGTDLHPPQEEAAKATAAPAQVKMGL